MNSETQTTPILPKIFCCSQQRDYFEKAERVKLFTTEDRESQKCFFCNRKTSLLKKESEKLPKK